MTLKIGVLDTVLAGQNQIPWEEIYTIAGELGLEGQELGVGDDYEQTALWRADGREKLRRAAESTGVVTSSICLHTYWSYSFADTDEALRARAGQIAREAVVAAKDLGAKQILIPLTNPKEEPAEIARERWIEGMLECVPAAEEAGVVFSFENVGVPFADKAEDIIGLIDSIASPAVKVYYDPANAVYSGEDPLKAIPMYGDRIGQVHVKEAGGTYIGDGTVPWPGIIDALDQVGYDGWLILETDPTDDPKAAAKRNLRTIRGLLPR